MIHVVASPSAEERLRAAQAFLERLAGSTEVVIVGASRDAADDLARQATLARGATFGLHRTSLTQLAVRCAATEMAQRGVAPATALGARAVAARAAFEALREDALDYFAPVARLPGFGAALAATLTELRLAGLGAAALPRLDGAGRDVRALLERFERQLDDGKLIDRAAFLSIAARAASAGALEALHRVSMLLLDVPVATEAERAFVDAVTARSPIVLATVPAGDDATLQGLRALAERRERRVSSAARAAEGPAPTAPSAPDLPGQPSTAGDARAPESTPEDLARARTFLFAPTAPPRRLPGGDVVFFSAPGEGRETVEIARRVLEEARAGTPFDRMAVLLRAPEIYASLLATALQRAGIAAWFARGTSRPDPSGRAFLALLDCALEGLSARRFAEYLSLGQVPSLDASGAPPADRAVWIAPEDEALGVAADLTSPVNASGPATAGPEPDGQAIGGPTPAAADPDTAGAGVEAADQDDEPTLDGTLRAPWKWEQLLVESAVIGGQDRWRRRILGLEAEYRARLALLRQEEADSPRAAALERDLRELAHLRRFAMPVIDRLAELVSAWPGAGTDVRAREPAASAYPTAAGVAHGSGGMSDRPGGAARRTWGEWIAALETLAPMVLRRPERVLSVLAALRPLATVGPVALGEVRDVLAGELTTLTERPPPARFGRLFVGTIEQARGRSFDVVFLPGLAERLFPQKPREDPMLLDAVRRQLAAPLLTQAERSHRERLLLRLAVGVARRRLYASYSRIEQTEARPRVPSFYALEVARALTGRVPEPQVMERAAAVAAGARLAWPAPDDPAQAIDEVEHDLATLRRLLPSGRRRTPASAGEAPSPRQHGRARYLLELNDALARSLRMRWARWHRSWSPADGIVRVIDGTRETLAASRLGARPYSPSALQKFAACPYQFLLSAICRLEPRAEAASIVELDPMTRGHLFHRVQADAMRALADAGLLPLAPHAREAAQATLDRTLDAVADRYREELAPAIQRVWQDEVESMRADLRMWLEQSAAGHQVWEPIAFELAFGLRPDAANDPQSVEAEVTLPPGFRLRGIVDLVERRRDGAALRVTDYKTGMNFTRRTLVVGGGEMLQPVVYGLAVEQVLRAPVLESRLFYCTRAGGFSERVVPMSEGPRRRGLEVLATIDRAIAAGFLPAAPRARACGICDFRGVCGPHEEERITKKDPAPLDALRTLRDWP